MKYTNLEYILNNMLDFIAYRAYYDTNILQPQIISIYADLEKQYTL